ncbi:MAG: DNA mismatch repair protein MutS [candidate division WOR-3 bacterium]|nr:DNA mismatch repair protein MutS [candidate division WOR-3 bacterium]MDW7987313.1 DNA mismatch repair protein MutS [candidate division WOR-3 bacterium]
MTEQLTPLLQQYHRIKARYKDAILLFRMGDFYEMFYEDAKLGAKILGLTLTSRNHGKSSRVPLAGIPVKSIDNYIGRLVNAGLKVAICEQLEAPGVSKLIRRDVVEVITPGTILRPALLEERKNNFLLSVVAERDQCGIAYTDLSTGEFYVSEMKLESLKETIQKLTPKEIIIPDSWQDFSKYLADSCLAAVSNIDSYYFSYDFASEKLKSHFGVIKLEGLGLENMILAIKASGAILYYLSETQKTALPHIRKITHYRDDNYMLIDWTTRKNLELTERIRDGSSKNTLLDILDKTQTPLGSRLLRKWLLAPLINVNEIKLRQDAIEELILSPFTLTRLQEILAEIGDLERNASRIAVERANGRDIIALKNWLKRIPEIKQELMQTKSELLQNCSSRLGDFSEIVKCIEQTLNEEQPLTITEGGLIKPGYSKELDELRNLASSAKEYLIQIQQREREKTGIPNLRVGYNSVFGYYIEVTKSYLNLIPKHYIRKQTLLNCERFITPELKEYENKVLNAEERIKLLEYEIFVELRRNLVKEIPRILDAARIIAELDVLSSLAKVAQNNDYSKPIVDNSDKIEIVGGRHPVVEKLTNEPFVPNDTLLDLKDNQILIITGPNMAGKSTYLRQVALITIMAQIGSFVPAKKAHIGIVDKIFTRIGASDDLAQGVSTFLAEMMETANILNNATTKSLVILDEIGRGTATYDGLAIAWAVIEYLHQNPVVRPRTLFATHYHELTDLAEYLPRVKNYNFIAQETKDTIIFLRKLMPGKSDRSYGLAVAKLAGIPISVIDRAKEILKELEKSEQLSLQCINFEKPSNMVGNTGIHFIERDILEKLKSLNINELTPIDALNFLSAFQNELKKIK